eukprot:1869635-Lingulodinium_polyedra.AAC.1
MPRADEALPWPRWTERVGLAAVPGPPLSLTALSPGPALSGKRRPAAPNRPLSFLRWNGRR